MPAEAGKRSNLGGLILPEIAVPDKRGTTVFPRWRSYAGACRASAAGLLTRGASHVCRRDPAGR